MRKGDITVFEWYRYIFEDGCRYIYREMSEHSIREEKTRHGALIALEYYGRF